MNEQRPLTDSGGGQLLSAAMQWGLAESTPSDQIQPKIVVDLGQTTVLAADSRRLQRLRAFSIRDQLEMSSLGVSPPQ